MGEKPNEPDKIWKEIAELKEKIKNRNIQIDNINDRKNEQQREINELKEDNEHLKKTIFDWLLYSSTNREVLRDYLKYKKDWTMLILKDMSKNEYNAPIANWIHISQHKICEGLLEKLDSVKRTEKNIPDWEIKRPLGELEGSGGEKELPKHENGLNHMHGSGVGNLPNDSKPAEPEKELWGETERITNKTKKIIEKKYKEAPIPLPEVNRLIRESNKELIEPEKYPKVVYQLGSDSKEYIELKKKYDKLIEDILNDWYELDNELTLEGKVRVQREKIEKYKGI